MTYQFKSQPFAHQLEAWNISKDLECYALLMTMGTGKSKIIVDTAAYLWSKGRINSLVIVAPNGVHRKWLREDIPLSLPDSVDHVGAVWRSTDPKALQACERLLDPGPHLRILCINVDALSHTKGRVFLDRYLNATDSMLVIDESHDIKNKSKRTETAIKLADKARYRRILSGTSITNGVFDLYHQFLFLSRDIFGQSFVSYKNEYAELEPASSPTMQAIARKGVRFLPQIPQKDANGRPKFKNLDRLRNVIAPHSYIKAKEDCLDLPDKIYETRYVEMSPEQKRAYNTLALQSKVELEDSKVSVLHKMTLLMRLQQITGGFVTKDSGEVHAFYPVAEENPKVAELKRVLDEHEGQAIIWARFVDEIRAITEALGGDARPYYGDVSATDRETTLELYKQGKVRYIVGTAASGGVGLNLLGNDSTNLVIYFSNDFDLKKRLQSEDRVHRIGQTKKVTYVDLVVPDSVDEKVLLVLKSKEDVANAVLHNGDIVHV